MPPSRPASDDLARLAVLQDPTRRRLYDYVVSRHHPVGRDAVSAAVDVPRRLVAFHLDKLVEAGLLEPSYRRLNERSGPGAGRPAKLYQRADTEVSVTVPPRDYELAARVFTSAVERLGPAAAPALADAARATGAALAGPPDGRPLREVLTDLGYEPYDEGGCTAMRNCPFHRIRESHRTLVCSANLELIRGLADRLDSPAEPVLDPADDRCCVVLREA